MVSSTINASSSLSRSSAVKAFLGVRAGFAPRPPRPRPLRTGPPFVDSGAAALDALNERRE